MEFAPKLPEENVNVSKTSPLLEFASLALGLTALVFAVYWGLGLAIDWAVDRMTPEQEEALSLKLDLDEFGGPGDASPQSRYLQTMVDRMQSDCTHLPYRFKIVYSEDRLVNAVALPGGTIVVFQGLLDKLTSENALAFVLGHEMGHFNNRDHLKQLGRGLVLMILWSLVAGDGSAVGGLLTPSLTSASARHSQGQESQADEFGLKAVQCRYGHISGATQFFESMAAEEDPGPLDVFFQTHPASPHRIGHLAELAKTSGFGEGPLTPIPAELLTKTARNK